MTKSKERGVGLDIHTERWEDCRDIRHRQPRVGVPMTNWIAAIVIGVVIGVVAGQVLGRQSASARWMAPALSVVGALIAAGLGAAFGTASMYGWKKAALQIVLALVGAGAAALLSRRTVASG